MSVIWDRYLFGPHDGVRGLPRCCRCQDVGSQKSLNKADVGFWIYFRLKHCMFIFNSWPGYLDNTVAGGIPSGYGPMQTIIKEAMEEASIPEEVTKAHARAAGVATYCRRSGCILVPLNYLIDRLLGGWAVGWVLKLCEH